MATQNTHTQPRKKKQAWKSFQALLRSVKLSRLPWFWLLATTFMSLFYSRIWQMIPSATQEIMAGNVSIAAITTLIAVMALQALLNGVNAFVSRVANSKISLIFRETMLRKVMRLPLPFYDKNMADRLISRTTDDTTKLGTFIVDYIFATPGQLYAMIGSVAAIFAYDWHLVAMTALMLPTVYLVTFAFGRIKFTWQERLQLRLAELSGRLAESLMNIPLTKVFVQEQREKKAGLDTIEEQYRTQNRFQLVNQGRLFMSSVNNQIQLLISVLGGVYLINQGYITVDMWIAYNMYYGIVISAFNYLCSIWEAAKTAQGASSRISEIIMEPDESIGGGKDLRRKNGDITFEDVTFGYDRENPVLRNLSFTIPQGKTTAIIGRSGEGKSTLFALLERFYQPDAGRIAINGVEIKDYDLIKWRQAIGYVSQNNALLSGTVRDNITYGIQRQVTEEEIVRAAKDANAYEFIQELEKGFDTQVGISGSKLSGGQRQRICIARELLKDPQLLLLDEATSSLDMEAEYQVTQALDRLRKGRTTLVVSHRLSQVIDADKIVYLEGHALSGAGTHRELLEGNPSYQNLVRAHQGMVS